MFNRRIRRAALCGSAAAGALLALGSPTVVAAQAATYSFDIPAQDVSAALIAYGRTSRQQLVFDGTTIRNKTSSPLVGEYAADDGLYKLLEGTGLRAEFAGDGAVRIVDAAAPQSGSAAGDGADSGTVEALIVTAQKREEDIQDVPIAISAFTQEQLERSQVAGGPDLMTQVPNMTFTKTNFSSYSIQLRGIGTQAISATTDPAVAVAFNNSSLIRNRFFEQEFYDLQRVEVLRGPQGTLYGRNATAGVVNLISQKPKLDAYEAKVSGDVANYGSTRLEGMLNIPLANDVMALRIAGAWTKRNGYSTNELTGNSIDGRDLWSTRLSLRLAPTDALDINLIWEHFQEDDDRLRSGKQLCKRSKPATIGGVEVDWSDGSGSDFYFSQGCEAASLYSPDSFQAPMGRRLPYYLPLVGIGLPIFQFDEDGGPFDPYERTVQSRDLRVIESTFEPIYKAETDVVELQASFDLSDTLTLTSETSYVSDTIFSSQDYNRFSTRPAFDASGVSNTDLLDRGITDADGVFCDPQIGCTNRLAAVDLSTADSHQFGQELRLSSDFDGPFNFSVGANFLRYDTEDKYYVFINALTLYAIRAARGQVDYERGVTDNSHCLSQGFAPPDPEGVLVVIPCVYVDPNPIGSLNDLGHNYFLSRNPYKLLSYAVFGEAYYNLTPNLKLTGGFRWTVDKKEAPRIPSWVVGADTAGYPVAEVVEQEWREPTGRLAIDWKPDLAFTDETLLYASYSHGYKAGGANPPAAGLVLYELLNNSEWVDPAIAQAAVAPRRFGPEFVDAYELGAKNTMLDGALTLNAAAFYYDYTGYQISQIVNRAAVNLNFDAKVWGLELEADWRPVENLRLGFKGGYEQTEMAKGSRAIDTMDRTAGNPDWYVTGPFPSLPANCVLPAYTVTMPDGTLRPLTYALGGNLGPCEWAYVAGIDPLLAFPTMPLDYPGYPGFDADDYPEVNGGAGFYKDLSGNELPNAPHFTATLTADYTLPLPNQWLMTLHTDLYYQSEAWTRVFNTEGYDKLKAYSNINFAAIFANDEAGWKVMAYVKNVLDRDSITGAFLNSDDTGLTTNVFLTEPRLYGLRVTKDWNGGPWWTGANLSHTEPYPLTVELGGQVQRQDAPYEEMRLAWADAMGESLDPTRIQNRDLDWGDGRSLKLTWRPEGTPWTVSAAVRYGRTNTDTAWKHSGVTTDSKTCGWQPSHFFYDLLCAPGAPFYDVYPQAHEISVTEWGDASVRSGENHTLIDFAVGMDVGIGGLARSTFNGGLRHAEFESKTTMFAQGLADWLVPVGWRFDNPSSYNRYHADIEAEREFKGMGPTFSWDAAVALLGNDETGRLNLDWSLGGAVLFGKQKTTIVGSETSAEYVGRWKYQPFDAPDQIDAIDHTQSRSRSVTVPVADLSLGLSYEAGRIDLGVGYRWERYFDVLDAGFQEQQSQDRTIDGPYFKIAVGFGG